MVSAELNVVLGSELIGNFEDVVGVNVRDQDYINENHKPQSRRIIMRYLQLISAEFSLLSSHGQLDEDMQELGGRYVYNGSGG
jgi:hypothetical protein